RRARVEEHKKAMLGELRRQLDLTQVIVAERLDVTQENISQIERGEADVRLSTLSRYVEALGGRLEIRAAFPEETFSLSVGAASTVRRRRSRGLPATAAKRPRNSTPKKAKTQPQQATRDPGSQPNSGSRSEHQLGPHWRCAGLARARRPRANQTCSRRRAHHGTATARSPPWRCGSGQRDRWRCCLSGVGWPGASQPPATRPLKDSTATDRVARYC